MNAEFRLMFVSAIDAAPLGEGERSRTPHPASTSSIATGSGCGSLRSSCLNRGRRCTWSKSADPAATLLDLARANHVDLIVIGAPGPSDRALAWWRSVASTVTANAPCSVHVVRIPEREHEIPAGPRITANPPIGIA